MIREFDDKFEISFAAVGLSKDDINIEVVDNTLSIKAENDYYGKYNRLVYLSDYLDLDNIKAKVKDGLLTIDIPKSKENVRKILVE